MAERAKSNQICGLGPQDKAGRQPACRLAQSSALRVSDLSEAHPARQSHHQHGPAAAPEPTWQPPAAPAATEVASVHLARWAPHPSAETAPGTEPSPRTPALVTLPPRQKLVDEATSVKAATPAADPSSLPVAETFCRRAATTPDRYLVACPGDQLYRGVGEKRAWPDHQARYCGPSPGRRTTFTPAQDRPWPWRRLLG